MRPYPNATALFHRLLPLLPVMLAMVSQAQAQRVAVLGAGIVSRPAWIGPGPNFGRSPGPGAGWSYTGVNGGPTTAVIGPAYGFGGWGYPAAVGSFWTNGLSLYGPPVPTYAPVPGSFGGSDAHRFYMNPPVFGFGLNAFGYRSPSPRLATPSVSVYPASAPVVVLPAPSSPGLCRMEVRLPDQDAEVWINRSKTKSSGLARTFESPELKDGAEYEYELVARWTVNGEKQAENRKVMVTAGKTVLVDFREESPLVAPKAGR